MTSLRYQIVDEDGTPLRLFQSRQEAEQFFRTDLGETLRVLPRKPKFDPWVNFEEALL